MKPPRKIRLDTATAEDPLEMLISAIRAGRLVALLRGEGLTRGTVEELFRPESAAKLRAILNERVFSVCEDRNAGPGCRRRQARPGGGKVLAFKGKERFGP